MLSSLFASSSKPAATPAPLLIMNNQTNIITTAAADKTIPAIPTPFGSSFLPFCITSTIPKIKPTIAGKKAIEPHIGIKAIIIDTIPRTNAAIPSILLPLKIWYNSVK